MSMDLVVIEDAAQSIGANINGRPAGAWGHFGCISFYPTKNLGGMGDGGMIVTNDEDLQDRVRLYSGTRDATSVLSSSDWYQ